MLCHFKRTTACLAVAASATVAAAQFATPTVDGVIGPGEYGNHSEGANKITHDNCAWYMTWDNTNLYIAIEGGAPVWNGAVVYIDANPVVPSGGGTDADGTTAGFVYDSAQYRNLNMRADFVTYLRYDYREYRKADGANGWGSATTGYGSFAYSNPTNREIAIPWSAITGAGRPATFTWFGYIVNDPAVGWPYGAVPSGNPEGTGVGIGVTDATHHFAVSNTADGTSSAPFGTDAVPVTVSAFALE